MVELEGIIIPKTDKIRLDLCCECNICAYNNRSDRDIPCSLCSENISGNRYDDDYGNYQKVIG